MFNTGIFTQVVFYASYLTKIGISSDAVNQITLKNSFFSSYSALIICNNFRILKIFIRSTIKFVPFKIVYSVKKWFAC